MQHNNSQNVSYGSLPYGSGGYGNVSQIYSSQVSMMQDKENIPSQLPLTQDDLSTTINSRLEDGFKKLPKDIAEKTISNLKNKMTKDQENLKQASTNLKQLSKDFTKQMSLYLKTYEQISSNTEDLVNKLNTIVSHYIDSEILLKKAEKTKKLTEVEAEQLRKISELCDYKRDFAFMEYHKNIFMQENMLKDLKKILEDRFGKLTDELMAILAKDERAEVEEKYKLIKEITMKLKAEIGKEKVKPVLRIQKKVFDINQHLDKIIKPPVLRGSFAFYN
jgi:hypothetical protein